MKEAKTDTPIRTTEEDLIARGYVKYPRAAIDPETVKHLYQKKFTDKWGTKYYIAARMWDFTGLGAREATGYEYSIQLYQKDTHNAISMTFHSQWTIEDVEAYAEVMFRTGRFDYYELNEYTEKKKERIYLAATCSKDKREFVEGVAQALEDAGYDVYRPFWLQIEHAWDYSQEDWSKLVFDADVHEIDGSDIFIMLTPGRNSSAGTNWEQGRSYTLGKRTYAVQYTEDETSLMTFNGGDAFDNADYNEDMKKYIKNVADKAIALIRTNGASASGLCRTHLT